MLETTEMEVWYRGSSDGGGEFDENFGEKDERGKGAI